jgi:hypothetical protein
MTIEKYSARFMELARFAANLVPNEESKVERFKNGLNPRVKERVMCLEIKDYARLMEVASIAERGIREFAVAYDLKKCSKQQMSYPAKRSAIGSGSRPFGGKNLPPAIRNQGPPCSKCGKIHTRDCLKCFSCGQHGHFSRNCTKRASQQYTTQAQVYSFTLGGEVEENEGEEEYSDVVTGTIPLFGNLASTFFYSGATYSFISSTYVKLCSMITQPLNQNIIVSTLAGDVVTCRKIVEDCPIVIEGRVLPVNLAVFHMLGFDKFYGWTGCQNTMLRLIVDKKKLYFIYLVM